MNTGKLVRKWQAEMPDTYNRETGNVCMDILSEPYYDDGAGIIRQGYSFVQVQIDNVIDYGHIKSQLIEAAFSPKDELALSINAARALMESLDGASSFASFRNAVAEHEDTIKFREFNEYRLMCANTAHAIWRMYNHPNE